MKTLKIIISNLLIAILLAGCIHTSWFSDKPQVNTVCPPYPVGGQDVAEELKRIPFNGWPALERVGIRLSLECEVTGNEKVCAINDELQGVLEEMEPGRGFEHLYEWLGRVKKLKAQLDRCKS